ncbi:MAG: replicative DNA helicase [Bacteroidetes bacterium]|nr:replicative DNA helicase [Bacteroidota bacterium]
MAETPELIKKSFQGFNKKNTASEMSFSDFGKLPPQALDLERAVLGALLIDSNAMDSILGIIEGKSFYNEAHKSIFQAIHELMRLEQAVDMLTITEQLRKEGKLESVGGAYYIAKLTNTVSTSANIEFHARIVAQKYVQREIISQSSKIIKDAFEDTTDVFELLDKAESNLFALSQTSRKKDTMEISSLLMPQLNEIQKRMEDNKSGNTLTGVGSGFMELDKMTSGWQKSDLIIVAGRPAMGKTAFTLALARNAAIDFKKPVAFFSLEMSAAQLVQRMISMESEINAEKLRKGDLRQDEWTQLITKIDKLETAPILIDDTPAMSIFELRAKARKLKRKHDINMIIIDYLQLMSGGNAEGKSSGNREQEISSISRALKGLAKELDIPIIALSQLSRAPEQRTGSKKPQLSDLRESGAIEQDADMVMFLYRPEYYGIEVDENNNNTKGIAEVIIAKHRNGSIGSVNTRFINQIAKFVDLDYAGNFQGFETPVYAKPTNETSNFISMGSKMNEKLDDEDFTPF